MARPVGTGSLGVGTKETVAEEEMDAGETEKNGRSGKGSGGGTTQGCACIFCEPVACSDEPDINTTLTYSCFSYLQDDLR